MNELASFLVEAVKQGWNIQFGPDITLLPRDPRDTAQVESFVINVSPHPGLHNSRRISIATLHHARIAEVNIVAILKQIVKLKTPD